jgi:(R,R)-butanediol dehydrogenase/meso-butanediol dehydrogenase/diacetyl reductase
MVVPFWDFLFKDITIRPALAYTKEEFAKVIQMLSEGASSIKILMSFLLTPIGKFDGYTKLISTRIGLSDLVEKGFKELIDKKDKHLKILVTPK